MLLPMEDAWPAWPGTGFHGPAVAWLDEDGELIEPMPGDPSPDAQSAPWDDDLSELIALRPSRRLRRTRPHA